MLGFTEQPSKWALILYGSKVPAGFPSPADDHVDRKLDLNEHLIRRPAATFFVKADGASMLGAGIGDGDLLVVDRSLTPGAGDIVIAVVHGELTVKRLRNLGHVWVLAAESSGFPDILLDDAGCDVWGVVTHSIRRHAGR